MVFTCLDEDTPTHEYQKRFIYNGGKYHNCLFQLNQSLNSNQQIGNRND